MGDKRRYTWFGRV